MHGPLKHANKAVRTESSTVEAAVVKATISTTSTQAQDALQQPLGLSVLTSHLHLPSVQTVAPTQVVEVTARCTTVEKIRSYTPTAFSHICQT